MNEKKKWFMLDERSVSNLVVILVGILVFLIGTHFTIVRGLISTFMKVAMPFVVGFAIAYLLNGPASFLEEKVFRPLKCRRGLAVLLTYIIAVAILGVLVKLVLPQIASSIVSLYGIIEGFVLNFSSILRDLAVNMNVDEAMVNDLLDRLMISYTDIVTKLSGFASKAIPQLISMGFTLGSGLVSGFIAAITTVISSVYMLLEKHTLVRQSKKLVYAIFPEKRADRILRVSHQANNIFSGFINGKILDSAIIGVMCFFLTNLLRIDFAVLISVVIGVTNVIPFFGPIIGAVPFVVILLIVDPWQSLRFALMALALQQFDGNILGPKILGDSTGISAFWVLVSIVIGGGLFGFPGMLLSVPTFAVIYALVREWTTLRLKERGLEPTEQSGIPKTE